MLAGAILSITTMPLAAVWFLLLGGLLLIGDLVRALVVDAAELGRAGFVGLGILLGPAIYISLAVVT